MIYLIVGGGFMPVLEKIIMKLLFSNRLLYFWRNLLSS